MSDAYGSVSQNRDATILATDTGRMTTATPPMVQSPRLGSLRIMADEVYAWAETKGWEPDPDRTFGDVIALLHSEVSEALEAWRDWDKNLFGRVMLGKPEGVGSEFADVFIRLLHYCKVYGIDLKRAFLNNYGWEPEHPNSFGDACAYLHYGISNAFIAYLNAVDGEDVPERVGAEFARLFARLLQYCGKYGIDLQAEYDLKMKYNHTREYRHGGRSM